MHVYNMSICSDFERHIRLSEQCEQPCFARGWQCVSRVVYRLMTNVNCQRQQIPDQRHLGIRVWNACLLSLLAA